MKDYINDFEARCKSWNQSASGAQVVFVFNEHLKKQEASEIKYILVADNPGGNEKDKKEYLTGDAGIVTRLFFERFLVESFDREVLVLNKTPISTSTTEQLGRLHEIKCRSFINSQKYMAELVSNLSLTLSVPVIVMGFSGCRNKGNWDLDSKSKKAVGIEFYKSLKTLFKSMPENLFIIKHFSRNSFFDDFKIEDYRSEKSKAKFFEIGANYRKELIGT